MENREPAEPSFVSMKSDGSMPDPPLISDGPVTSDPSDVAVTSGLGLSEPKASGLNIHPLLNCQSCVHIADSDQWVQIEPSAYTDEEGSKFRVSTDPGRYECARTKIRWVCDCNVTLQYGTIDGRFLNGELERLQFNQIAPVTDMAVISGELEEVHLPHYACLGESDPSLKDSVKVLTVTEEGITTEPVQLTRFHAKIVQPSSSLVTLIMGFTARWYEHCDLLLYRCFEAPLILHLYIFPFDDCAKEKVEKSENTSHPIKHPRPDRPFQMKTPHMLAVRDASSIHPKEGITFRRETPPNFFKVNTRLKTDLQMTLTRMEDDEEVWTVTILKDELLSSEAVNQLRKKELIVNTLMALEEADLKAFKWYVKNNERIPPSEMNKADSVLVTVDKMVAYFGPEAVKITVEILRKMKQNPLAEQLEKKHDED